MASIIGRDNPVREVHVHHENLKVVGAFATSPSRLESSLDPTWILAWLRGRRSWSLIVCRHVENGNREKGETRT